MTDEPELVQETPDTEIVDLVDVEQLDEDDTQEIEIDSGEFEPQTSEET